jgi:glc operon protein GlcG
MKTCPRLQAHDVKQMLAAAEIEAERHQWPVVIAIVDDGGHALGLLRMDGVGPASVEIALAKARTAATSRRSSADWEDLVNAGRNIIMKMPGILPARGGLPIMVSDTCVGAIGVSGVKPHDDEQVARAALAVLTS